jgi:amino acid permease
MARSSAQHTGRFRRWFFEGMKEHTLRESTRDRKHARAQHHTHSWWQVMCLTGVDYFSTLGYQPGIAFLAAGALSPIATLILVALTLFGALPIYSRVAEASPNGEGSISMLERLLSRWKGKLFVLALLGFAATDFVITITLSAADATEHIVKNPFVPPGFEHHKVAVTFALLLALGAIFVKGFKEAIGLAVVLVTAYLALNCVVIGRCVVEIAHHPEYFPSWKAALLSGESHGNPLMVLLLAALVFPRLALGLSGFETGVAVMPQVKGDPTDSPAAPAGRIHNTKMLLRTAALIMSVMLIGSSFVTTLLIPSVSSQGNEAFHEGGEAYGRALSFLANHFFGPAFATVYDVSTIFILWFAGASAMAALINLVPRYLPRYGMAPEWAKATRPLVLVFVLITLAVTWIFDANVEAQGGAYATGVLVLMTSAAFAVTLLMWKTRWRIPYGLITVVFAYTTIQNIHERPEGIKIASFFIGAVIVTSLVSRTLRSIELRVTGVVLDEKAARFVDEAARRGVIRVVTNRPDRGTVEEYDKKEREARDTHHIPKTEESVLILEVQPGDASEFADRLDVTGHQVGRHKILRTESAAVPNAIAALLIHLSERTGKLPHVYFGWTEGNPLVYVLKFIAFGEGDTAPVTREVLRQTIDDPAKRPRVHVG